MSKPKWNSVFLLQYVLMEIKRDILTDIWSILPYFKEIASPLFLTTKRLKNQSCFNKTNLYSLHHIIFQRSSQIIKKKWNQLVIKMILLVNLKNSSVQRAFNKQNFTKIKNHYTSYIIVILILLLLEKTREKMF